jgi:hypothetical protein
MNLYSLEPVAKYLRASNSQQIPVIVEPRKSQSVKGNFLANPYSEYEERKKRFNEEYSSHLRSSVKPTYTRSPDYPYTKPQRDFSTEARVGRSLEYRTPGNSERRTDWYDQYRPRENSNIFVRPALIDHPTQPVRARETKPASLKHSPVSLQTKEYHKPGAAYRDTPDRSVDKKQFMEAAKTMLDKPLNEPLSNLNYIAQERIEKVRRKEEVKRALDEQIEQKRILQDEVRRKKMVEDRLEEARVERQRIEIDSEVRREILEGQMSKTRDDPPPYFAPQKKPHREAAQKAVSGRSPPPFYTSRLETLAARREPLGLSPLKRELRFDAYRLDTESYRQSSIQDTIQQIKEEARLSKDYINQGMLELQQIKEGLHLRPLYDDYGSLPPKRSSALSSNPPKSWDASQSKLVPLSSAGRSVLHSSKYKSFGSFDHRQKKLALQDYESVESADAKQQLSKLDELLQLTADGQLNDDEFARADREDADNEDMQDQLSPVEGEDVQDQQGPVEGEQDQQSLGESLSFVEGED